MGVRVKDEGQFKEMYVKALDSMPVGAEIDFDGQVSDIPVGWEPVSGFSLIGTTLYEPITPTTDANITLNGSVANYDYIEVYYYRYAGSGALTYDYTKIKRPNNKRLNITMEIVDANNFYIFGARYDISGTSLTYVNGGYTLNGINNPVTSSSSQLYIEKIIGYKEV